MTVLRTLVRAAAAFSVAGAGLVGASTAPASAAPGACTTSVGVVVVVDFRPFGGSIQRGCDPNPTTGYAALHNAGFPTVGTQRDGPGFVCRISGLPTAAVEPCVVTPSASHYWSYWHADRGQSGWSYSQLGATSYHPTAGSVDAWVYGATDTGGTTGGPSFSVSSVRATDPAPAPAPSSSSSSPPPAGGGTGSGGGSGTGSGGSGTGTGGSGSGSASGRSTSSGSAAPSGPKATSGSAAPSAVASASPPPQAAASPSATTSATPDPTASSSATDPATDPATTTSSSSSSTEPPVTDVRAAPVSTEPARGSAWPVLGGLALLAALAATAGVVALRRRRSEG